MFKNNVFSYLKISNTCQDTGDVGAVYAFGLGMGNSTVNSISQVIIDRALANPSVTDIPATGFMMDDDTSYQGIRDIQVTQTPEPIYRANIVTETFDNVSWKPGFDPSRMEVSKIGLKQDFPKEYLSGG